MVILSHAFLHDHEATDLSDFLFKLEFSLIMCFFLIILDEDSIARQLKKELVANLI